MENCTQSSGKVMSKVLCNANDFSSLNRDDAFVHWDSTKVEYLKGGNTGPMIDIKKLIDIIGYRS
ncbi:MAG: hypothetical protein K0R57_2791 [Paenibacillaceae bacterium]|jgi:hypothetical protein|nr:hypothetical protein [Paenibacillaceae bacterium]